MHKKVRQLKNKNEKPHVGDSVKHEPVQVQTIRRKFGISTLKTCLTAQSLILMFLVAMAIIFLTVLLILIQDSDFRYCTSKACSRQASTMIKKMNTSADPCNDFYNYACGNWKRRYPATPGVLAYSDVYRLKEQLLKHVDFIMRRKNAKVGNKVSKSIIKAKIFYKACSHTLKRNNLGARPLKRLIWKLGGWTLTTKPSLSPSWDFLTTLVKASNYGKACPLMAFTSKNPMNSSQYMLKLRLGCYFYKRKIMLKGSPPKKDAFMTFVRNLAKLVGNIGSTAELNKKLEDIWDFEMDMAMHATKEESKILTLAQLQQRFTGTAFNIFDYLKRTYGYDFKGMDEIWVTDFNLSIYIANKIKTTSKETLANYMVLECIKEFLDKLSPPFKTARLFDSKTPSGMLVTAPEWKKCVVTLKKYFPMQVSAKYVEEYFRKEDRREIRELVNDIKEAMRLLIRDSKLMSSSERIVANKKLDQMQSVIAYSENIFDVKELDKTYQSIKFSKKRFFQNYLEIRQEHVKENRANLKKQATISLEVPLNIDIFFSQTSVSLQVLASIAKIPLYSHNYYATSNFGAIGFMIAREINKAFIGQGRYYDQDGNSKPWWTKETKQRFEEKNKCFIDQYSKYSFYGIKNEANLTVDINMLDDSGMQASFLASKIQRKRRGIFLPQKYLPGLLLNENQLFFLAFAQNFCGSYLEHTAKKLMETRAYSPYPLRVLGVLSNAKEFAKAFECPHGSTYNPSKRCSLW